MYSAEVLSQLRSLNWLTHEIHRVPVDSRESAHLQNQMDAVRARLPDSILAHHDQLARCGQRSAAQVHADACGGCRSPLSPALRHELAHPGRFGLCPQCGIFLWAEDSVATPAVTEVKPAISSPPGNAVISHLTESKTPQARPTVNVP